MQYVFMVLMFLFALFMILLVLVQRGKGGGLAGALGGMGGQSAFGTKAGDLFTKVTIVVAAFWIILCMVTVRVAGQAGDKLDPGLGADAPEQQNQIGADDADGDAEKKPVPEAPADEAAANEEPAPKPNAE